jgi:hypothetical protein
MIASATEGANLAFHIWNAVDIPMSREMLAEDLTPVAKR